MLSTIRGQSPNPPKITPQNPPHTNPETFGVQKHAAKPRSQTAATPPEPATVRAPRRRQHSRGSGGAALRPGVWGLGPHKGKGSLQPASAKREQTRPRRLRRGGVWGLPHRDAACAGPRGEVSGESTACAWVRSGRSRSPGSAHTCCCTEVSSSEACSATGQAKVYAVFTAGRVNSLILTGKSNRLARCVNRINAIGR